jgi:hypothetical protein
VDQHAPAGPQGPIYQRKCEPETGFWRSLGWGLAYPFHLLFLYVVSWRAVGRVISGRNGWAKTRRNAEAPSGGPVAGLRQARGVIDDEISAVIWVAVAIPYGGPRAHPGIQAWFVAEYLVDTPLVRV